MAEVLPNEKFARFVKERRELKVPSFAKLRHTLLIGGQWIEAASGKTFPVYNPANGEVIAHVQRGTSKI